MQQNFNDWASMTTANRYQFLHSDSEMIQHDSNARTPQWTSIYIHAICTHISTYYNTTCTCIILYYIQLTLYKHSGPPSDPTVSRAADCPCSRRLSGIFEDAIGRPLHQLRGLKYNTTMRVLLARGDLYRAYSNRLRKKCCLLHMDLYCKPTALHS